jgi:hypothetical protein
MGTAVVAGTLLAALGGSAVLAGEITGSGKPLTMHGRSECSFSGQEDLQYTWEGTTLTITRGSPAHAQSWGQIPKATRDFLATIGLHPGMACNPMHAEGGEP